LQLLKAERGAEGWPRRSGERTNKKMAHYSNVSLDPEEFAKSYAIAYATNDAVEYTPNDNGGYSNEAIVDEALAAHGGAAAAPPPWKEIIANIGPAQALSLGERYVREAQDRKHRMGDLLEGCFKEYLRKNPGDQEGKDFYHWLDAMPDLERVMMVANADRAGKESAGMMRGSQTGNIKPSMVKAFMKGVAYLDRAGRRSYRVSFNAGTLYAKSGEGETELSTMQMSTVFSGKGFGIWVISKKGNLYVGNHVKGMLHHSSFLAGAKVMCGGEMWARNGKILFLSGKSGHYEPGKENMDWALNVLENCVDNFDAIKVAAWRAGADSPVYLVSPRTFLWSRDWKTWGKFSKDEMARLQGGNFAGFPSG
jgi:hypothetical protein